MFHRDIQTLRRELKIQCAGEYFDEIRGVWIADEKRFECFIHILNRSKNLAVNRELKSSKQSMIINKGHPNLLYRSDSVGFKLKNYYRV